MELDHGADCRVRVHSVHFVEAALGAGRGAPARAEQVLLAMAQADGAREAGVHADALGVDPHQSDIGVDLWDPWGPWPLLQVLANP